MSVSRKKAYGSSRSNPTASVRPGRWLTRIGLRDLVFRMRLLAQKYGLVLMMDWDDHLDDPDWLGQMMAKTFMRLDPCEKDSVRSLYEDWLWFEKHVDMQKLVEPEYNALCYLLDARGNRVRNDKGEVTVLRGLKGQDKQEALAALDTRCYEFKEWW